MDHDRLFKELLTTFFYEFVELLLPEVGAYLEAGSVVFLDKEVFTDVTAGARYEADLVARARFRGEEAFFLIHLEHQAQPQAEFGRRMFRYFSRLHELHGLPVYPVVIFSFAEPRAAQPEIYEVKFPDRRVLEFSYRVIQLNRLRWRDFVTQPNPVAGALMARMQIAKSERPFVKAQCLRLLATLRLDRAKMHLIAGFVDTYLRLTAAEETAFRRALAESVTPEKEEEIMELMTSWEERGWQRGVQQGVQQGLLRGKRDEAQALIRRLLEKRVGPVSADLRAGIDELELESLESLAEALLDFKTESDLAAWIAQKTH